MDIFFSVIQGSYAYLLIGLIVVVSVHFLFLLWLVAKRIREPVLVDGPSIDASQRNIAMQNAATVAPGPPEVLPPVVQGVPQEVVDELKLQISNLEKERAQGKTEGEEMVALRDKIKYLESKLLEYEILQEEIGALSALKVENEQLKKKIHGLEDVSAQPTMQSANIPAPEPAPEGLQGKTPLTSEETDQLENLLGKIDDLAKKSLP